MITALGSKNLKLLNLLLRDSFSLYFSASTTEEAECETGTVRLTNFTDDTDENSRQGTMQICINSAWGDVCSDNFFDTTDAEVFCEQLDGFNRTGLFEVV